VGSALGPRQLYYYFNGHRIGDVGNDGMSPTQFDYAQVLAQSGARLSDPKGAFRYGKPVASADFDENYQPINDQYPGMAASIYTVNAGDTLQSIAQAAWGDAAMWYLIADANGLSATATLQAGQRLIIPNKVANFHNNSTTFKVYDPGEAIGDTLPTLPPQPAPPHKKHGCGGLGAILVAVIAIAVAIALPEIAPALAPSALGGGVGGAIASGAITGAIGSAVGQGFGVATGLQDKFSWKGVALAAISGAVGGGFSKAIPAGSIGGSKFITDVARGAISNAATQGISVATGLQHKFDWTGVAVGGVVGGAVGAFSREVFHVAPNAQTNIQSTVSGVAGAIAGGAMRSLLDGTDFGDNVLATLPDVIGTTIGNAAASRLAASRSGVSATSATADKPEDQIWVNQDAISRAATDPLVDIAPIDSTIGTMTSAGGLIYTRTVSANAFHEAALAATLGIRPDTYSGGAANILDGAYAGTQSSQFTDAYDYRFESGHLGYYAQNAGTDTAHFVVLQRAEALADANSNALAYYGIGLPAQLAAEAVTGELAIGAAVKGYRLWTGAEGLAVSNRAAGALLRLKGVGGDDVGAYINSFEGQISVRFAPKGEGWFRYTDRAASQGDFLAKTRFANSEAAVANLHLEKYNNFASLRQDVTSIKRSLVLEGGIKNGGTDITQTLITNRKAFTFGLGQPY
jgi:hypothetical protein